MFQPNTTAYILCCCIFLSNYKLSLIGIWLGKITSWAFFLDDVIVGNDINQVYSEKRGINVQDKHNMHL